MKEKPIGKKELIYYSKGVKLTPEEAIVAMCYFCMGYFADGNEDCEMPSCPLYPFMPYKKIKEEKPPKKGTKLVKICL